MQRVIYTRELSKTIIHHSQPDIVPSMVRVVLGYSSNALGAFIPCWVFMFVLFRVVFIWRHQLGAVKAKVEASFYSSVFVVRAERGERIKSELIKLKNEWCGDFRGLEAVVAAGAAVWPPWSVNYWCCKTPQCRRDEPCLERSSQPSGALLLSPPPFLSQQGFYSQLNISTENLIRICKSLGRGECNN